ncbi:MAG: tetraacyldisaccharide 4'-kinase, partial [Campylobacteraceae bacterium]|nr:tetraacyldisaccharide 4'-kinase [Campylobacteraceae bacterium]
MKQKLVLWVEEYLFFPTPFQKLISLLLIPLTFIYHLIIMIKRANAKPKDFGLPIISVGNLIVGGSGKTPVVVHLAQNRNKCAVILRGYGRASKGLYVISHEGKILEDINTSGDEAMLLSKQLPSATIIVSENREEGIVKAKKLDCEIVFLDDGFSKYSIRKFDILLRPLKEPTNIMCLPSGGYREPKMMYSTADLVLQEGIDFTRVVSYKQNQKIIEKLPSKLLLLTAISKANRLLEFLPTDTKMVAFEDHHVFTKIEIDQVLTQYSQYNIITTAKDMVKLEKFKIRNLYLMDLE